MSSFALEPVTVACALAMAGFAVASIQAEGGEAEITAAAFGDIYDMSDGAKPIQKGGGYNDIVSGDTWYTTWAGDGTAYLIHDDGLGFNNIGGLYARHRLCRLEGDPNASPDGFRGVNLNPGLLGNTIPNYQATPEWRIGYSSSIYEQDGVLYEVRHNWSKEDALWPPIDSSLIKSADGGKTWSSPAVVSNTGSKPAFTPSTITFCTSGKLILALS